MDEKLKELRIAVIGIGGIGGLLGGLLAEKFPNVTFVARGERAEDLKRHGLTVRSEQLGEWTVRPKAVVSSVKEAGEQDLVLACVKNYSLDELLEQMPGTLPDATVIVPVMNGTDPGDRIRQKMPKNPVLDALIYCVAFIEPAGAVRQQGPSLKMWIGQSGNTAMERSALQLFDEVMAETGLPYGVASDIRREIWKKYLLNCAYNVLTAYYDCPIGEVANDPKKLNEYRNLVLEAYGVGLAKGIDIRKEDMEEILNKLPELDPTGGSSLQRDLQNGRPSELETFGGYIVEEARCLGLDAPLSERFYQACKALERKNKKDSELH